MSELQRISITIDPDLLQRLDGWAQRLGVTRSEALRGLIREKLGLPPERRPEGTPEG